MSSSMLWLASVVIKTAAATNAPAGSFFGAAGARSRRWSKERKPTANVGKPKIGNPSYDPRGDRDTHALSRGIPQDAQPGQRVSALLVIGFGMPVSATHLARPAQVAATSK